VEAMALQKWGTGFPFMAKKKKHAIFYPFMEGMGGCNATTLRQEPRFLLHDKMEETRQDFPSIASQTLWKA
jgi:hypothetical protein